MTTLPPGSVIGSVPNLWLHEGWRLARTTPGALKDPSKLAGLAAQWHEAVVPGTVAAAIHKDINLPGDYDADDWWYQLSFPLPWEGARGRVKHHLRFEGLATLAEVWLNGTHILTSRNMFMTHRVDVTELLREHNDLVICFRSLGEAMKERRARPKWKTQLVANQNLRWFRTTLLGRIPGWTPAITPVGPWGPIGLESIDRIEVRSLRIATTATTLDLRARVFPIDGKPIDAARVRIGEASHDLAVDIDGIHGRVSVDVPTWWPHTHGAPHLETCHLELRAGGEWIVVDCGKVGFRDIRVEPLTADQSMVVGVK